jgi:hypothetical protein
MLVQRVGNLDVLERFARKALGLRGGPASKRQARGGACLTQESARVVKRRPRLRAFQGGLRLLELPDPFTLPRVINAVASLIDAAACAGCAGRAAARR